MIVGESRGHHIEAKDKGLDHKTERSCREILCPRIRPEECLFPPRLTSLANMGDSPTESQETGVNVLVDVKPQHPKEERVCLSYQRYPTMIVAKSLGHYAETDWEGSCLQTQSTHPTKRPSSHRVTEHNSARLILNEDSRSIGTVDLESKAERRSAARVVIPTRSRKR